MIYVPNICLEVVGGGGGGACSASVRPSVRWAFPTLTICQRGPYVLIPPPPPHPTANRNGGGGGGGRRGGGKGRSKRRYPGQNPKGITVTVKGLYTRRLTVYHTSKTPSLHHHHVETPARSRTTMTHTHTHTHRNSLRLVPVFRLHSARELDKRHKGAVNVLHRVARAEKQTHNKKRRSIRRAATRRDDNPHHENQAHSGTVGTWQLQVFTTRRRREMALARV